MAFGVDDLVAGAVSAYGAAQANKTNLKIAREQMGFQREMSNTAHQREVADLRAAGLNPLLSVNAGASSPVGGTTRVEDVLSPAVNTAMAARRQREELKLVKEQVAATKAQSRKTSAEAWRQELDTVFEYPGSVLIALTGSSVPTGMAGRRLALMEAQARAASAAAASSYAGLPEREGRGALFSMFRPFADMAARGNRGLVRALENYNPLWLINSARDAWRARKER